MVGWADRHHNQGIAVTDQTVPESPSTADPLSSDPLADDYGTVVPPPPAGSAIPPAPRTPPRPLPDPTTDRFSAFDDPAAVSASASGPGAAKPAGPPAGGSKPKRRRKRGGAPRPGPAATPQRSTSGPVKTAVPRKGSPSTVSGTPKTKSRLGRVVLVVVGALVLLPVVVGVLLSRFVGDSDTKRSPDPAGRSLVATEVTASPSTVAELPATVTTLRVEFQGPGRTADVRLYTPEGSANLANRTLPYAVDLPVRSDDAYVSVSADDYGYRGSQPMRCTISVGDTVLATAVGTKSVDCKVTDGTWRRDR